MVSQWNSSGIFSQHSIRCSSVKKSKVDLTDWEKHQKISQEEFYLCQCSTTFLVEQKTMKKNVWQMFDSFVSLYAKWFGKGHWSFMGPGSEKKWYSIKEDKPQGIWDKIAEKMLLEFAESKCPIFRATTPLRLKSKRHGNLSIHYGADLETIETIFRLIVSVNQFSVYEAIEEMFEEYESVLVRTWQLVVMGQSIVLSAIKQNFLWIVMTQRIKIFYCNKVKSELKGCHNKIKLVNFWWMQDSWQRLMSDSDSCHKTLTNSHNSQIQWLVVSTLCQEKKQHHNRKAGSKGTPNFGPCWKLQVVVLHG